MALKAWLFRFSVDGRVVGGISADGEVEWGDLEALRTFMRQHLTPSRLESNVETTVGVDLDLVGLPSELHSGSRASARIQFAVEERVHVLSG